MRYGTTFAYFQKDWNCDYLSVIPRIARIGFQILEVGSAQLLNQNPGYTEDVAACAKDYGVELFHAFSLGEETDISSENAAVRKNGEAYVERVLELVHRMGGRGVGGINYVGWNCLKGHPRRERRLENSVESMKAIMKRAEDLGITYHIEVTNGYEQFLLNTAAQAVEYCQAVGSSNLKILLDVNHMLLEEDSFYTAIKTAGQYLAHFHVAQNNRKVPVAAGFLPWKEMADGLSEVGYDEGIVLEPLVISGGEIGESAKIWHNRTEDTSEAGLDKKLAEGLTFLRGVFGDTRH